ncbi:MAG: chromosome segregation protein SMC [Nitrospirota bacterium]
MFLKKIELLGFKSFYNKTRLNLLPGITVIVGPNGCGKSNISDVILWGLGEQSYKTLRGNKMEDVIFNGSEDRKPSGMAEVTLTMADTVGELDNEFSEYREVTITRRLFRSGDSEYYINKIPCRLRDIRDLLIDTGAGSRNHSIIEQGKVDYILNASPIEKREIIEDTAGIAKYKNRKTETLRSLEHTNQNLIRVRDILSEIKRQVNSLDRQAKKAAEYKTISNEIRDIEIRLSSSEYESLTISLKEVEEDSQGLKIKESELLTSVSSMESMIEEIKTDIIAKEKELDDLRDIILRTEGTIQQNENKIEFCHTQSKTLTEQSRELGVDIERLSIEINEHERQKEYLLNEEKRLSEKIGNIEDFLRKKEDAGDVIQLKLNSIEESIEKEKGLIFQNMTALIEKRNKKASLEFRHNEIRHLKEKRKVERDDIDKSLVDKIESLRLETEEIERVKRETSSIEKRREEIAFKLETAETRLRKMEEEMKKKKEEFNAISARLYSLKELQESFAGYREGVRNILLSKNESDRFNSISGVVTEILDVPERFEKAIEAVMGDRIEGLIVGDNSDIKDAIRYLKETGLGRGIFIPVNVRKIKEEQLMNDIKNGNDILGGALEVIKPRRDYYRFLEAMLGDVIIVRDIDTGIEMWNNNHNHKTIVTLEGEVIDPSGIISGGDSNGSGKSLLRQKREIADMEGLMLTLKEAVSIADREINDSNSQISEILAEQKTLEESYRSLEIESITRENRSEKLNEEIRREKERLEILDMEEGLEEKEVQEIEIELSSIDREIEDINNIKEEKEKDIDELNRKKGCVEEELTSIKGEITQFKVEIASLRERRDNSRKNLVRVRELYENRKREADNKSRYIVTLNAKIKDTENEITGLEEDIHALFDELTGTRERMGEERETHSEKVERIRGLEGNHNRIRKELVEIRSALQKNEIRITELRLKIRHEMEFIQNNYHLSINEIIRDSGEIEINKEEARERLSHLKDKIEKLGHVNLSAIEEYKELNERYEFLKDQEMDLTNSIESLHKVINKINKTIKRLFLDTFYAVNEKFSLVFNKLFEGGEANIILLDEDNPLESGIDIVAQPPGKKLKSISLLSGGEKALIAIAMLFATFLVQPSPFCVLDEIDAPLDEENIRRFTNMLKAMTDKSQFIIITHSRQTMEIADLLYGVTMEEHGISKLVSVKLEEYQAA